MGVYWLIIPQTKGLNTVYHQKPDTQSDEGYEVKRITGNPRFCRTCDAYKPPRAHHCSQCRRYAAHRSLGWFFCSWVIHLGVYSVWVSSLSPGKRLPRSNGLRSSLPLGEQLCWPFQLWSLYSVSFLRWCFVFVSPFDGRKANVGCAEGSLLGKSLALT